MGIKQRYWKSIVLFSFCTPKEGCGSISGWRPITGSHRLIRVCDGTASLAAKSQRRGAFLRSRSFAAAGSLPDIAHSLAIHHLHRYLLDIDIAWNKGSLKICPLHRAFFGILFRERAMLHPA
ncbi:unnamed protein product [Victoria cruziana]